MNSAMNDRRLPPDIFHDVELAAVRPVGSIDVVAQHPKCGPDTLAVGDLNTRFKTSVGLTELILGEQSCRSVVAGNAVGPGQGFLERFDYQHATFEVRVCRPARIGLELVVTPTITADIIGPLA